MTDTIAKKAAEKIFKHWTRWWCASCGCSIKQRLPRADFLRGVKKDIQQAITESQVETKGLVDAYGGLLRAMKDTTASKGLELVPESIIYYAEKVEEAEIGIGIEKVIGEWLRAVAGAWGKIDALTAHRQGTPKDIRKATHKPGGLNPREAALLAPGPDPHGKLLEAEARERAGQFPDLPTPADLAERVDAVPLPGDVVTFLCETSELILSPFSQQTIAAALLTKYGVKESE